MILLGTLMNAVGILGGIAVFFVWRKTPSATTQDTWRTGLAMVTLLAGLHLFWTHLGGGFWGVTRQTLIVMVSLSLGSLTGYLLGLQKGSNRLGSYATHLMEEAVRTGRARFQDGFLTAVILFCVAPISLLGALQEGLIGDWRSFAVKTCVDTLGAMSFAGIFGLRVLVVLVPVVAWHGSLTLGFRLLAPWLNQHGLVPIILATSGMLLCALALQIIQIRRIRVTDYLPCLVIAPALTALSSWLFR